MPRTLALFSLCSRLLAFLQISLSYLVNTFRLPFDPCAHRCASKHNTFPTVRDYRPSLLLTTPRGLSPVALDQSWSPFYFPILLIYQCSLCAPCRLASSYKNPASGLVKGRQLRPLFTPLSVVCSSRTTDDQRARRAAARPLLCSKSLSKRFACSATRSCLADIDALLHRQPPSPSIDYSRSDRSSRLRVAEDRKSVV